MSIGAISDEMLRRPRTSHRSFATNFAGPTVLRGSEDQAKRPLLLLLDLGMALHKAP